MLAVFAAKRELNQFESAAAAASRPAVRRIKKRRGDSRSADAITRRFASLRNEILITIRASVVSVISNMRLVAQLRGNRIVRRVAFSNVHLYTCVYFENVDCQLSAFILFGETEDNAEYFSRNNSDKFTVMKERLTISEIFCIQYKIAISIHS